MEDISLWKKDALTNTYPRIYLEPYLERLQIEYNITKSHFSVIMIDLDHFKPMNDKYGHSCGDDMLKYFTSSLRLFLANEYIMTTANNLTFRYGGDEFIIVFPGKSSHEVAKIISSILEALSKRQFIFNGRHFKVTFSGGVATFPDDAHKIEDLVGKADKAMYFSKKHGKARISEFSAISFEKAKMVFGNFVLIIAFMFSVLLVYLSTRAMVKNFVFVDKINKVEAPRSEKLKKIYLKNGSVIIGVILNDQDPIEIKLIMDKGEGMMRLYKVDILRIASEDNI